MKKLSLAKKQVTQPGLEAKMDPKPFIIDKSYRGSEKLKNKVAIVTGGDSGIGHSVAIYFAKEGADVAVIYLNEHKDAKLVKKQIENIGRQCLLISGDLKNESFCKNAVKKIKNHFGKIHILVNNAGEQHTQKNIRDISAVQMKKTFETNIFSYFYMIKAVLPFFKKGAVIINTASVTSYKGSDHLIDYSATKGAIVTLTRSLSESLIKKGIRVNGVAPGPIWTPLIDASFTKSEIKKFGKNVPMKRPGQPREVAPCYVFLASDDSSYMSGQILHPNGGVIVNG
ncbi:MAG TPA: SDR family oxidoreductase [Gammaproteobacteria bacterium]|jgi:NAD(P)-dependent dehydrogenase (short-subunit alcohol dehydrogenase family)|nr:SDR family oxidoreductase [Gammaproteobacteria bacterium]